MARSNTKQQSTELAKQNTDLASGVEALPDFMKDTQFSGQGFENVNAKDLIIPRAKILQGTSPEVAEGQTNPNTNRAYKLGDIVSSIDGSVLADGEQKIEFIAVGYNKAWVEWAEKQGDGIIGSSMDPNSELANRCRAGEKNSKGKPAITEYHQFLVFFPNADDPNWVNKPHILGFARTNYKHGRKLLTIMRQRSFVGDKMLPIFASTYYLWTEIEKNKDGQPYRVFQTTIGNWVADKAIFKQLNDIHVLYKTQEIKPHYEDDSVTEKEYEESDGNDRDM